MQVVEPPEADRLAFDVLGCAVDEPQPGHRLQHVRLGEPVRAGHAEHPAGEPTALLAGVLGVGADDGGGLHGDQVREPSPQSVEGGIEQVRALLDERVHRLRDALGGAAEQRQRRHLGGPVRQVEVERRGGSGRGGGRERGQRLDDVAVGGRAEPGEQVDQRRGRVRPDGGDQRRRHPADGLRVGGAPRRADQRRNGVRLLHRFQRGDLGGGEVEQVGARLRRPQHFQQRQVGAGVAGLQADAAAEVPVGEEHAQALSYRVGW
ncbi:hypothetical protein [Micromonospora sp. NBS 11-29]|uniref:hypothetical protein n=1 Tax=Micromonospora sp. NBS 11-29 TaxID=1960879 RepID=UPI001120D617|nr:hypothetical protein [Micromonospora sp. NBS 11-29]